MLPALQDVPFLTEALVTALAVFTLLVTNAPYLAVIEINTGTAVIDVDDVSWGTEAFTSKRCLVALVLAV